MAKKKRRNRGHFKKGHDPRRHVLTFDERSRGGQVAWQRMMQDAPHLLRWLQRKIDGTAHPGTLKAYRRRKHPG
jgi:hypothetical protein